MSEAKFTPGPWTTHAIHEEAGYGLVNTGYVAVNATKHFKLATVVVELDGEEYETGKANAHLIAAAPDLYAALLAIEQGTFLCPCPEHMSFAEHRAISDQVSAALAKARGEVAR